MNTAYKYGCIQFVTIGKYECTEITLKWDTSTASFQLSLRDLDVAQLQKPDAEYSRFSILPAGIHSWHLIKDRFSPEPLRDYF